MEAKFECSTCGSLITFQNYDVSKKYNCSCKKSNLVLLSLSASDEETKEAKQKVGKAYEDIQRVIEFYMDMPLESIKVVALWIVSTYFHNRFNTFPELYFNAMRGSGKTRILNIISHLAYKGGGKVQTGARESLLFRTPKHHTLVFDEMESIGSKEQATLREYFNSCYKRGGVVSRTKKVKKEDGETFEIEEFEPFKPIVMANIWGMDDVLENRCISIVLEKSSNILKTKLQEDFDTNPMFKQIKRTLEQFSVVSDVDVAKRTYILGEWNDYVSHRHTTLNTYTTLSTLTTLTTLNQESSIVIDKNIEKKEKIDKLELEELFRKIDQTEIMGRNLELFFPLFLTINSLDPSQTDEILNIAKGVSSSKIEKENFENTDILMYEFISEKYSSNYYFIKDLTTEFRTFYGADQYEHKWINERWLSRCLRRLNLIVQSRRLQQGIQVMLNVSKANEKKGIFSSKGDEA